MLIERNSGLASNMKGYPFFSFFVVIWGMMTSIARSALTTSIPHGNTKNGSEPIEAQSLREIEPGLPVTVVAETEGTMIEGKSILIPQQKILSL